MNVEKLARENQIYEVISGSNAYGLNGPSSDIDTRGIFIAPLEVSLHPFFNVEQFNCSTNDEQIYELKKFMNLLLTQNPNIIELLWIDGALVKKMHPIMNILKNNREKLLSSKVRYTFSGYAFAQLKRIKGHKKHIMNPMPETPPNLIDYVRVVGKNGIELKKDSADYKFAVEQCSATKVNEHTYKLWYDFKERLKKGLIQEGQTNPTYIDINLEKIENDRSIVFEGLAIFSMENYHADINKWKDYWRWKRERNPERAAMEEKFSLDLKHATHLIRLLRMGKEILTTGEVLVARPDRDELLAIKNGEWTYERVIEHAEGLEKEIENLCKTTTLRREVDPKFATDLYLEMLEEYHGIKIPSNWRKEISLGSTEPESSNSGSDKDAQDEG